jgi:hypothetical protein
MRPLIHAVLVLAFSGALSAQGSDQPMALHSSTATSRPTRALLGSLFATAVPIGKRY